MLSLVYVKFSLGEGGGQQNVSSHHLTILLEPPYASERYKTSCESDADRRIQITWERFFRYLTISAKCPTASRVKELRSKNCVVHPVAILLGILCMPEV